MRRSGMPGIIGKAGCDLVQRLDLRLLVHTEHNRALGRVGYRPTTSWIFSTNSGSLESLNPSSRCGLSSNVRQIRPMVDFDSPVFSAIFARDQCVAFAGVDSSVVDHDVLDLITADRRWTTRPRLVEQPIHTERDEPRPPFPHRDAGAPQLRGHALVVQALGASQHDPRPQRQSLRRLPPAAPTAATSPAPRRSRSAPPSGVPSSASPEPTTNQANLRRGTLGRD